MTGNRISYALLFLMAILLGILSRKLDLVPLFVGDLLYAVMVYFGISMLFASVSKIKVAIIALLFCYGIEIMQLVDTAGMVEARKTMFGRYVLGQGFLWSDIFAYTVGITIAYCFSKKSL